MKNSIFTIYLIGTFLLAGGMPKAPLSMKSFYNENRGFEYMRGSYLIILAHSQLSTYLSGSIGGSFIEFKESQGRNTIKEKAARERFGRIGIMLQRWIVRST